MDHETILAVFALFGIIVFVIIINEAITRIFDKIDQRGKQAKKPKLEPTLGKNALDTSKDELQEIISDLGSIAATTKFLDILDTCFSVIYNPDSNYQDKFKAARILDSIYTNDQVKLYTSKVIEMVKKDLIYNDEVKDFMHELKNLK